MEFLDESFRGRRRHAAERRTRQFASTEGPSSFAYRLHKASLQYSVLEDQISQLDLRLASLCIDKNNDTIHHNSLFSNIRIRRHVLASIMRLYSLYIKQYEHNTRHRRPI